MATAYTPGLTVSADSIIRKVRRLPIKGEVLVREGDAVTPETVVARASLPGGLTSVRAAERLGVEPGELARAMKKRVGEVVESGEVLAETRSFFGLFTSRVEAPVAGTIEFISEVTGNVGIRHPPTPVEVRAYIQGTVVEVSEGEGVVVETRGALVQGIFGIGGETHGEIAVLAESADEEVPLNRLNPSQRGRVLVCASLVDFAFLDAARRIGAAGVVVGGVMDADVHQLLGYDLGVAITGHEQVGLTLIATEGFGSLPMAPRTFELLRSLNGRQASISGATQIRAGVIRPEVIVPREELKDNSPPPASKAACGQLEVGTHIRIIREPYFGRLARVVALPPELQPVETGAKVRLLEAELEDGRKVTVPRANVEIVDA